MIPQQSQLERALIQPRRRERPDALADGGARDRERIERIGLAARARALARSGHQLRRHPHDALAARDQKALQAPGHVPAVLQRPHPLAAETARPAHQHIEPVRVRGCRPHPTRHASRRLDRTTRDRALVRIAAQHHHVTVPLQIAQGTPADTAQSGRMPRSYQVTPAILGRRRATQQVEGQANRPTP